MNVISKQAFAPYAYFAALSCGSENTDVSIFALWSSAD